MADIAGAVIGAVTCVTQCLSTSVGRRFNRMREFKSNVEKLKTEIETLKTESRSIQRKVDKAKKNGDDIDENVQNWLEKDKKIHENFQQWLNRASKFIGDDQAVGKMGKDEEIAGAAGEIREGAGTTAVTAGETREGAETEAVAAAEVGGHVETSAVAEEIREDAETAAAKKRCFKWLCRMRYQLSKEVIKQLEVVVKHKEEAKKFDKISYPVIPKDRRLINTDYRAIESRIITLNNVISSLSDPNVNIVGIYGMGGIGKTTLAKEVAKQTEASKLFDSVIFVEVTEKPDIMEIQKEIAENLPDLTLSDEQTVSRRAAKLHQRLENEKNILIILDNVWAKIKLEEIGISLGDGRKLLLTARSVDVLEQMNSQPNFLLGLLDDEEAWQLFKKLSCENIEGSEFESVAREVAEKCARLPIVIVTVARALKNKALFVWRNASQEMGSSVDIRDIYKSIELSFKYLENETLMETILLIRYADMKSVDELLLYGMCLGIFKGVNNMEARRHRLLTLVQQLKDSCLLLNSNIIGEDFSMHDIVRDVAMKISTREGLVFTNELIDELEWSDVNSLEVCHSIVLKDVKMGELLEVLECQQLKLLSVSAPDFSESDFSDLEPDFSLKIHHEFFSKMLELKVLVLANMDLLSLPSSLRFLTKLKALGLYNCQLDDVAIIGDLKKLEILSLKKSKIEKLPVEVGHLARLKSLDLRGCSRLLVIPPNVILSLSHLEELYMGNFSGWEKEGLNEDRKNVSLDELKNLSNLTCLQIVITDAETLPKDLSFKQLKRYNIKVVDHYRHEAWDQMGESCRKFELSLLNTNICLKDGHIMQLKGIEELLLEGTQDMESVVYGLDRYGFPQLKYLEVRNNDKVLCIVDSKKDVTLTVFPLLESLRIKNLINLEKICHGQLTTESSFGKLKKINVYNCAKLKNIFSFSIARRLQLLQSINVCGCTNMEEIFSIEREDEYSNNINEVIDNIKLSQLRSLRLRSLPQLKTLDYNSNGSNTLFSGKIVLPNLEVLELHQINVERIWQNSVAAMSSGIQNLTKLILSNCYNLKCLFSSSMIESFDRLQYLEIDNCPSLKEIMVIDDEDGLRKEEKKNNVTTESSLNQLRKMEVKNCAKLENLFSFSITRRLQLLQSIKVCRCQNMKVIFSIEREDESSNNIIEVIDNIEVSQLRSLRLLFLPQLKSLDSNSNGSNILFSGKVVLPNLEVLELYQINVERIWQNSVAAISSGIQNLTELKLWNCYNLKCLFSSSMIESFDRLKIVWIENCTSLEEIMVINDDEDELRKEERKNNVAFSISNINSFLQMTVLTCPKLKTLFSRITYKIFLRLESLDVSKCDLLEVIFDLKDVDFEDKQSSVVNTQLSKLDIYDLPKLKQVWNKDPKKFVSFEKLRKVRIIRCDVPKTVFPATVARSLSQSLESLTISRCEEIVSVVEEESEINSKFVFPRLLHLELGRLPKFIAFFSGRYTMECSTSSLSEKVFPRLEKLNVGGNCRSIIWKFPEDVFCKLRDLEIMFDDSIAILSLDFLQRFRNLTTLDVGYCNGLTNIITSSTAKSMGQLREMKICYCYMITELVLADEGDEVKDYEIVFKDLKKLELGDLESLANFCSANYTFKFPCLEELILYKCPIMKSFSGGKLNTPKLQKVQYKRRFLFEDIWKGDLNTTIQKLYEEKQMVRRQRFSSAASTSSDPARLW